MSDDHPKCETMSSEQAIMSNRREMAAIVEVQEQRGLARTTDGGHTYTSL